MARKKMRYGYVDMRTGSYAISLLTNSIREMTIHVIGERLTLTFYRISMSYSEIILTIEAPADAIVTILMDAFRALGLRVNRSFDLQSACAPHHSPCPHHGTIPCSCQLVVLMLYDWEGKQYGLTIHGSEGQSEVAIIKAGQEWSKRIIDTIVHAIATALEIDTR